MSKKVLSFLLIAAILLTSTLFSGVFATAETKTWAVGDQPYAVEGKSNKIEVYNASSATFYDDFVIPPYWNFEDSAVIDANTLLSKKALQLNGKNGNPVASNKNPDTPIVWLDLSAEKDGVNENAYGGNGNSVKVTTTGTYDVKNGRTQTYYNSLRRNDPNNATSSFVCKTFPSFDDIAISFWVKTEYAAYISAAFWDTSLSAGAQKLYTDDIYLPAAGEYIIVLPISSFHVNSTAYVKNEDISNFLIKNFEIMFKSTKYNDGGTADFYFDNIGVYAVKPNFKSADTSDVAKVFDNFNDYKKIEDKKVASASKTANYWYVKKTVDPQNCGSMDVNDNNGDRSVVYNATNYPLFSYTSKAYNVMRADDNNYMFSAVVKDGTNLGINATLAFRVKASRATTMKLSINNQAMSGWVQSAEHQIPAGESIVRIPLSEFGDSTLTRVRKMVIYFGATAPTTNTIGGTAGTFEIDDMAFEPTVVEGDVNGDKVADILDVLVHNEMIADGDSVATVTSGDFYNDSKIDARDAFVLRRYLLGASNISKITPVKITQDSFVLSKRNDDNWKVGNDGSFSIKDNAPLYYSGEDNTSAIVINYTNIKTDKGSKIYYDAGLKNPYGSDGVFGFWVYSDQSVNLRCGYKDNEDVEGTPLKDSKWVTITIPAGETFVTVDMEAQSQGLNYQLLYKQVYQFQINIWSNTNTEKTSGTIYFDSFGYYDKDTTNNIPAAQ